MSRQPDRFLGKVFRNSADLEHDRARIHNSNPMVRISFSFSHPDLGGFRGYGKVREYPDPDLTATFDMTRHRDTGCLDLARGYPFSINGLKSVLPESYRVSFSGYAMREPSVDFSMFCSFRLKHRSIS